MTLTFRENHPDILANAFQNRTKPRSQLAPEIFLGRSNQNVGIGSQRSETGSERSQRIDERIIQILPFRESDIVEAGNLKVTELTIDHGVAVGFGVKPGVHEKQATEMERGEEKRGDFQGDIEGDASASAFTSEEAIEKIREI